MEKKKPMRWKRNPRETGLRAVGAAPRGWKLRAGTHEYAWVSPSGGHWARPFEGWYWVCPGGSGLPHFNSYPQTYETPEEAKAAAMEYVKQHLKGAD